MSVFTTTAFGQRDKIISYNQFFFNNSPADWSRSRAIVRRVSSRRKETKGIDFKYSKLSVGIGAWRHFLVTADRSAAITIHAAESLRSPQIHFHNKRIIPSPT